MEMGALVFFLFFGGTARLVLISGIWSALRVSASDNFHAETKVADMAADGRGKAFDQLQQHKTKVVVQKNCKINIYNLTESIYLWLGFLFELKTILVSLNLSLVAT